MVIMTDTKLTYFTDEKPSLEEAQKLVGGLVQLIELRNGDQMLVNEEGIMYDLPINQKATDIALSMSTAYLLGGILGDAVILKGKAKWD